MLNWLIRPERGQFRLLRITGSITTAAGLLLPLLAAAAFVALFWLPQTGLLGIARVQAGIVLVWSLLAGLMLVAVGQMLHLMVAIWRALDRRD